MEPNGHSTYLETQVLTATPQKLRLMLIEGAIRFASQSLKLGDEGREEEAYDALIRSRGVITELLVSIRADESELTQKVAGIYVFLFQTLTEAQLHQEREPVEEVIKILEVERETWQQVCEAMPEAPLPTAADLPQEITAASHDLAAIPSTPSFGAPSFDSNQPAGGINFPTTQAPGIPLNNATPPGGFSMDA